MRPKAAGEPATRPRPDASGDRVRQVMPSINELAARGRIRKACIHRLRVKRKMSIPRYASVEYTIRSVIQYAETALPL